MSSWDVLTPVTRVELKRLALADYVKEDVRLAHCAFLRELAPDGVAQLLAGGTVRRFAPRANIYFEGERARSLFWVLRGEAWLTVKSVTGGEQPVELGPIEAGDVLGEGAFLATPQGKRVEVARAGVGDLDLAEFPAELIQALGASTPAWLAHLGDVHSRRHTRRDDMVAFLSRW